MTSLLILALLAAGPADEGDGAAKRLTDQLVACRQVPGDAERLACFDRASAALAAAVAARQVSVVDRGDVQRTQRSLFGFPLPRIGLFGGSGPKAEEVREIESEVASAAQHRDGTWGVTLKDGSSWRFTEAVFLPPQAGDKLRIKRGALGSYMGSIQGRIGVRIRREG